MLQLCQALRYLHSKQLLHCDIKSDNVILTNVNSVYHPMLIDFGKSIYISEAPSTGICPSLDFVEGTIPGVMYQYKTGNVAGFENLISKSFLTEVCLGKGKIIHLDGVK